MVNFESWIQLIYPLNIFWKINSWWHIWKKDPKYGGILRFVHDLVKNWNATFSGLIPEKMAKLSVLPLFYWITLLREYLTWQWVRVPLHFVVSDSSSHPPPFLDLEHPPLLRRFLLPDSITSPSLRALENCSRSLRDLRDGREAGHRPWEALAIEGCIGGWGVQQK